jgi:hypothetical protein
METQAMTERLHIRFNTGRPYQEDGQIVYATWSEGHMVKFADVSRGVYGRFNPNTEDMDEGELERKVMRYYDDGSYEQTSAAFKYFKECNRVENAQ